jgi:hypothetical protein
MIHMIHYHITEVQGRKVKVEYTTQSPEPDCGFTGTIFELGELRDPDTDEPLAQSFKLTELETRLLIDEIAAAHDD